MYSNKGGRPNALVSSVFEPWPWGWIQKPLGGSPATKVNYGPVMHYVVTFHRQSVTVHARPRHTHTPLPGPGPQLICFTIMPNASLYPTDHTVSPSPQGDPLETPHGLFTTCPLAQRYSQDNRMLRPIGSSLPLNCPSMYNISAVSDFSWI